MVIDLGLSRTVLALLRDFEADARLRRRLMSEPRLAGKRVIVTGAGQGLGREFALHLAGLGASVLAADIRPDRLQATVDQAQNKGLDIHATTTDVSDPDQTLALAATAHQALGGLDALVNNAAIVEGLLAARSTRSTRTNGTAYSRST